MSRYESKEVYSGRIDRISNGGNGIIEINGSGTGHINLGEIDESMVGTTVNYKRKSGGRGEIVSEYPSNPIEKDSLENKNDLLGGHL